MLFFQALLKRFPHMTRHGFLHCDDEGVEGRASSLQPTSPLLAEGYVGVSIRKKLKRTKMEFPFNIRDEVGQCVDLLGSYVLQSVHQPKSIPLSSNTYS